MKAPLRTRKPTSPGEILDKEFLEPMGLTQNELAKHIDCDVKVINRIVNGHTAVSAEMAIKLAATLRVSAEFWMNAQKAVDLYNARQHLGKKLPKPIVSSVA
jgi:antitoxin HigA-1